MVLCGCGRGNVSPHVNVDVYCGSDKSSVQGLLDTLEGMSQSNKIGEVTFFPLPYNVNEMNATKFRRKRPQRNFMLLCHSINNRRFSITDVTDSLYDDYLKKAKSKLKQKRVGVIAYDFPANDIKGENLQIRIDAFRSSQPSTFEYSCFATVATNLNTQPIGIPDRQLNELVHAISISSLSTKERKRRQQQGKHAIKDQHDEARAPKAAADQGNENPQVDTSLHIETKP